METLRLKHQLTAEQLIDLKDERLAGKIFGFLCKYTPFPAQWKALGL